MLVPKKNSDYATMFASLGGAMSLKVVQISSGDSDKCWLDKAGIVINLKKSK